MAAVIDPASKAPSADLVELRQLRSTDLDSLLREEIETWGGLLDWDFRGSADLVRRFLDQRSLIGYALTDRGAVFGYAYCVHDEHKGLIGDLYVCRDYASPEHERRLLWAVVELLMKTPYVSRIETQLMMLDPMVERLPGARYLKTYERNFMRIGLHRVAALRPRLIAGAHFTTWEEWHQEPASSLIPECYRDHIDSRINDQYDTMTGARRFLYNIVQYPGCGAFFRPASLVAMDRVSGKLAGLALASVVAPDVGHITQICVAPSHRRSGLGYELMRRSLTALRQAGFAAATLTVTAANEEAVTLYERMGFVTVKRFRALVWERF